MQVVLETFVIASGEFGSCCESSSIDEEEDGGEGGARALLRADLVE